MARWCHAEGAPAAYGEGIAARCHDVTGTAVTRDEFDVQIQDVDVLDEIEMTSNLMIAASETEGPLGQEAIDEILGVS